jgi:2-methylaconitate isomerase
VMAVKVVAQPDAQPARTAFSALGLTRTARRLMAGTVYVPIA